MDLVIEILIVDDHRVAHIARHQVTVAEVHEVIAGDYAYIRGREGRWLVIGKTRQDRFLTVVVGERSEPGVFGLVTARPARRAERRFYQEVVVAQGEADHE